MNNDENTAVARGIRGRDVARDFIQLVGRAFALAVALGLLLTGAAIALPAPQDPPSPEGSVRPEEATRGCFLVRRQRSDPWATAPTLSTEVHYRVFGLVGRARVTQRFRNGSDSFIEGVYVFPLPDQAAVDHMRMRVGERIIEGQIREREEARAEYRRAAESGRRTSLVEQQRPNIFTSRVANVAPGEEIEVEIELQQVLRFDEGEVRLRFPLVVGPRYIPGRPMASVDDGGGWSSDTDRVPDASHVTPPARGPSEALHNPVWIQVDLDAGFPVGRILSRHHGVVTAARGERRFRVRLRSPRVPADRDFELAWTPRDDALPRSARLRGGPRRRALRPPHPLPADRPRGRGEPSPARDRVRDRHLRVDAGALDRAGPSRAPPRPRPTPAGRALQRGPVQQHHRQPLPLAAAGLAGDARPGPELGGGPERERRDPDARGPGDGARGQRRPAARATGGLPHRRERGERGGAVRCHPPAPGRHPPLHRRHRLRAQRPLHDEGRGVRARDLHLRRRPAGGRGEDGQALRPPREPGPDRDRGPVARGSGGRGVAASAFPTSTSESRWWSRPACPAPPTTWW